MNSPRLDYHTIKRHKNDSKSPYQKPKFSWALRELLKDNPNLKYIKEINGC